MTPHSSSPVETDPRFPSGKWVGFFTDRRIPGKHQMELFLTFCQQSIVGSGRDWVGAFTIDGSYQLSDGLCIWVKQYIGKHLVGYRGFNEGKGIWGAWELTDLGLTFTGGFHIWPEGMPDPTQPRLEEEADVPMDVGLPQFDQEPVPVGADSCVCTLSAEDDFLMPGLNSSWKLGFASRRPSGIAKSSGREQNAGTRVSKRRDRLP